MVERREFRRHRVGGNVEITSVLGTGTAPQERATLVDCSLGGARVRVLSPRRRLFKALPPCLSPRDSLTCVLRLAPDYDAIDVFAEVVRVERAKDEPEYIDVGVRFFHDAGRRSHAERPMARLARIIEPGWSAEQASLAAAAAVTKTSPTPSRRLEVTPAASQRLAAQSARQQGQRLSRLSEPAPSDAPKPDAPKPDAPKPDAPKPDAPTTETPASSEATRASRTSQRVERLAARSARLPAADTGASEGPERPAEAMTSDRADARTSRRAARVSARHERRTSGRQEREGRVSGREARISARDEARVSSREGRVSGRLAGARLDPERATPPRAPSSDSEVVAWASSRLTAVAAPQERVTTADDEVTVRGSARLTDGKAVIELPGAFTALAREVGMTAHVTATADCAGLFVAERSPARLVVRELGGGRGAATFDYLVIATRRS